ncbi:MAG: serine--tRNA ligase [Gammaproteobacteria bacterium TMED278]|nr:serine--tRNA ligase [Gammaproteobacteria bacterium]OUX43039.1 MAG: serine--tRNA ligase [Gammaproteobacteria bacterium TMED278]
MIDLKNLRENFSDVQKSLARRGFDIDKDFFTKQDKLRKDLQVDVENLKAERNKLSSEFGRLKSQKKDTSELKTQVDLVNEKLKSKDASLAVILKDIDNFLLDIPNLPEDTVPDGADESSNVVLRKEGDIYTKNKLNHLEITQLIDTDLAAVLAGARFSVLKNQIAKLQRSLISFMLDQAIEKGYEEYYVPFVANTQSLIGTGQLPKFEEDLFKVSDNQYLIPTAEVPLTNINRDKVIPLSELPSKLTSHTPCFRSEAGSYGKDTKGLIRQHQFEKIELVQITDSKSSFDCLETLLSDAENILKLLELPYQVVELCAGDLGFSSCKTYDIEVWIPSQEKYREISSCSNFSDFQARRSNIKIDTGKNKEFAHTINGSGLAVGRTLVALIENNYDHDTNTISIPKVLEDYFQSNKIKL